MVFIKREPTLQQMSYVLTENYSFLVHARKFCQLFSNRGRSFTKNQNLVMAATTVRKVEQPNWLNEQFFDDIYKEQGLVIENEVHELKIASCTGVVDIGDNYASIMYRVLVDLERPGQAKVTNSYIVKALISGMPMLKEFQIFANEFEAYRTVPKFEQLWSDAGESIHFAPKCLKIVAEEEEILVLSDLKAEGFVMQDRFKGLDMEHVKMTLQKLAKFHAASVKYKEVNGKFGPRLGRKYIDPSMEGMFENFTVTKTKALARSAEAWNIDPKVIEKIEKWNSVMFKEIKYCTDPESEPNDFKVLCHGDLWLNNQMFKYNDENKLEDVIFIDYQISYWGNPVTDLFYFLLSSVQTDLVIPNYDYFFKYYHDNLVTAMKSLRTVQSPPSLKHIHIQALRYGFYVSSLLIGIVPIVIMEKNDEAKLENFMAGENDQGSQKLEDKMFNNPLFEKKMRLFLPFFDNKGCFDSNFAVDSVPKSDQNGTIPGPHNGETESVTTQF